MTAGLQMRLARPGVSDYMNLQSGVEGVAEAGGLGEGCGRTCWESEYFTREAFP